MGYFICQGRAGKYKSTGGCTRYPGRRARSYVYVDNKGRKRKVHPVNRSLRRYKHVKRGSKKTRIVCNGSRCKRIRS